MRTIRTAAGRKVEVGLGHTGIPHFNFRARRQNTTKRAEYEFRGYWQITGWTRLQQAEAMGQPLTLMPTLRFQKADTDADHDRFFRWRNKDWSETDAALIDDIIPAVLAWVKSDDAKHWQQDQRQSFLRSEAERKLRALHKLQDDQRDVLAELAELQAEMDPPPDYPESDKLLIADITGRQEVAQEMLEFLRDRYVFAQWESDGDEEGVNHELVVVSLNPTQLMADFLGIDRDKRDAELALMLDRQRTHNDTVKGE